ncbi:MAG: HEAT repeat domain-containing protein [Planctomycetota bacterium]
MRRSESPFRSAALPTLFLLTAAMVLAPACEDAERLTAGQAPPRLEPRPKGATEKPAPAPAGPWKPDIKAASPAARVAMGAFEIEPGFTPRLVAAEPMLANPVGMEVDHLGRIYVAECHRRNAGGCADNRDHPYWVDDDIAARTVEDRRAFVLKHHPEYAEEWTRGSEIVRMLVDENGDGEMDRSTIFADCFDDLLDGTGADCFFHEGKVWFACIPNMWTLEDTDGDGRADRNERLFEGFGVRYALRGHDLHGMVRGPDGRIYFSIGDRGYHVVTKEGKVLADPSSGAVFRCEPDGRNLEVFATGLRNPQDLAFDDLGHLITGDNNSDSDDKARIVYVVEGGITGWRMNFQSKSRRGPWVREGWWKTRHEGQAAFLIPPLAHLGNGPSGLIHVPGTGFPAADAGRFLLCDFTGSRKHSGIRTFKLAPDGAGLAMVEDGWFLKGLLATDVVVGADDEIYVCDWVSGWDGPGRGRVYAFRNEEALALPAAREAVELLRRGHLRGLPSERLATLLGHADQRVRLQAQYALADDAPDGRARLEAVARDGHAPRLARIHALWGLGQIGRREADVAATLAPLLDSADNEIRTQTARVLADVPAGATLPRLVELLGDESPRVRYFAALALGKHAHAPAFDALLAVARENDDRDLYLRHAVVMGLAGIGDGDRLAASAVIGDPSPAVRLVALLALRRLADGRVAAFLDDADPALVVEAARAIHDVPIPERYPDLAGRLATGARFGEPFLRRAISAHDLMSRPADAVALAAFAADAANDLAMRREALEALSDWTENPPNDRVLKDHRPRPPRGQEALAAALAPRIDGLLADGDEALRVTASVAAARAGLASVAPTLAAWCADGKSPAGLVVAGLEALDRLDADRFRSAAAAALRSPHARARGRAAALLARRDPAFALPLLEEALARDVVEECQLVLATLGDMACPEADAVLAREAARLGDGALRPEVALDLVEALEKRAEGGASALGDALAAWRRTRADRENFGDFALALAGGDAADGKKVFESGEADCRRCHSVTPPERPMAGPSLHDVGAQRGRSYLLEALVAPNRSIHPDFRQIMIETADDRVLVGRLVREDAKGVEIEINHDDKRFERITLGPEQIRSRQSAKSPMPEDIATKLGPRRIRDLVAYLATLGAK